MAVRRTTDRFLFESNDPRIVPVLRIGFAFLMLVYVSIWLADAGLWFSDQGVLTKGTAERISQVMATRWSLLKLLPDTPTVVRSCLCVMLIHTALLLVGWWPRLQTFCLFVWLVSFQQRNPLLCDGEDTLFRALAFWMTFLPLGARWVWLRRNSRAHRPVTSADCWALRLIQLQMAVIYASATWNKLQGSTWHDGTAMYYVFATVDHFGRMTFPSTWLDNIVLVKTITWTALGIEAIVPVAVWFRWTRKPALLAALALHLGIELTMHLFLFQWVMILGWLSFVNLDEWRWHTKRESVDGAKSD
ncbi:MAG: HTTM domain-containing protein [Planctomycetales bacterium]|nr:HTTM domain-containing protein [Planctomycetales bacterium]